MPQDTALVERIATDFLEHREELAEGMMERIREGVSEFASFDGAELWEAVRVSCLANLDAGLGALARDRELPESIPDDARDLALLTARLDLPLAGLLRAYRVGHRMMWSAWAERIEETAPDPDERTRALAVASDYLFEYVDRLSGFLTAEYTAERDRFMRSREQRRTQLVRDVLDGADVDPADAMRELDYDLRLEHVALVVSGPEPEREIRALARRLDAPYRLLVALAGDTVWAWLGRTRPFTLPEQLAGEADTVISLGDPRGGIEGFRLSHREAREAHAVAVRGRARAIVRYDEVALESLVAGDEARVAAFVARELRGIDGADARSTRLRTTLRAYFAAGQNASAAAAMLGVHEHTVSYRLRTIEERLGRPITSRRAELETALRLLELR